MPVAAAAAAVVGTVAAGKMASDASKKAAKQGAQAITDSTDAANATQLQIYNDQKRLLTPSALAGSQATAKRMLMTGSTPAEVRAYLQQTRDAFSGGGGTTTMAGGTGPASNVDWGGYYRQIAPEYETGMAGSRRSDWAQRARAETDGSPEAVAQHYWNAWGQNQGHTLPTMQTSGGGASSGGGGLDDGWVDEFNPQAFLESTPGYQFRRDEGQKGVERSAAARGRLFSGATGKALARYNSDYASGEWNNLYGQLEGLSGEGADSTGTIVNVAGGYGDAVSGNIRDAGRARASAYQQRGAADADFWGSTVPGAIGRGYGLAKQAGWFGS